VNKKLKESQKIQKEVTELKHEVLFFKEIFKLSSPNIVKENYLYNQKVKEKLESFIKEKLEKY
jgi:hypothetical protein